MDSATLRQEVSQTASEVGRTKQSLTFAVMEENNTDDKEKKGAIGNQIEKLKGELEGSVASHASAVADLRAAEGAERRESVAKEAEAQRVQQATIEKEAEAAKNEEKAVETKDKKPTVAKKDSVSVVGGESFDRTGALPQDQAEVQAKLLEQVQMLAASASTQVKDSTEDKPAMAAPVATAPAIAATEAQGVTKDSGATDAPGIKAAAGTSGAGA